MIWRFVNSLAFCVVLAFCVGHVMARRVNILYSLLVRNEERLQDYFAIRRCVRACADSEMLQVHTAQGCFCVSLPQQLFEPAERAPWQRSKEAALF